MQTEINIAVELKYRRYWWLEVDGQKGPNEQVYYYFYLIKKLF